MKKVTLTRFFLLSGLVLLTLLLFKNPFSERNLISNMEPYPDTIHYIAPARNFILGKGMVIEREGRTLTPSVPSLYSLTLIPLFLINNDPRVFYFTNIIIAFLSLIIFYKILKKLIENPWIIGVILFLYVSNYFIYWPPTLAMAENLFLLLFLVAFNLLLQKVSKRNIILMGGMAIAIYATKYAALPITGSFLILYASKILTSQKQNRKLIIPLFLSALVAFSSFSLFEYLSKGVNTLSSLNVLYLFIPRALQSSTATQAPSSSWFSLSYFSSNFPFYIDSITGHSIRFLWDFTPIVPMYVGLLGLLGIISSFFVKKYKFVSVSLLLLLFSQIIFMSTFYSVDARYIYSSIPILLLSFGLFLINLQDFLFSKKNKVLKMAFPILIIGLFIFSFATSFSRLKYQILLNFRHAETPWYYVSVEEANNYFDQIKNNQTKKPILISALPPYYVDYFSAQRYTLLPLSYFQEFPKFREIVWGNQDYTDLIKLYKTHMDQGYDLYISNYGLGNEVPLHKDYDNISRNFNLIKVYTGCLDACNIFKLSPKI